MFFGSKLQVTCRNWSKPYLIGLVLMTLLYVKTNNSLQFDQFRLQF